MILDQTIPSFLETYGLRASQQGLKMRGQDGQIIPMQEGAPLAAMLFEIYVLDKPRPTSEDLLLLLECYFRVPAAPVEKKDGTFRFGDLAEVTIGGEGSEPAGMFTVLYLKVD